MTTPPIPQGYQLLVSQSKFLDLLGQMYFKDEPQPDGTTQRWVAIRVEGNHVNTWKFAHGGFIASVAEIATANVAWDPDGPPCVAIDLALQFIGAPKQEDLLEVCCRLTKRTRSLVFTQATGEVAGAPMFIATSVLKIIST
jgi:acyl-coenzyme A thioesterase PaaI-like protein